MKVRDVTSVHDLNKVRGWLLVWVIIPIPHGVGAPILIARQQRLGDAATGADGINVGLLVSGVGGLLGDVQAGSGRVWHKGSGCDSLFPSAASFR
jgi:hypothetical protein